MPEELAGKFHHNDSEQNILRTLFQFGDESWKEAKILEKHLSRKSNTVTQSGFTYKFKLQCAANSDHSWYVIEQDKVVRRPKLIW